MISKARRGASISAPPYFLSAAALPVARAFCHAASSWVKSFLSIFFFPERISAATVPVIFRFAAATLVDTLSDPVSVAPGPQGIGLMPSLFTANPEGEVRINTHSIAICAETDESVKTKYIQATTGISVPDRKLILG